MAVTYTTIMNRAQDIALRFGKKWEDLDPEEIAKFITIAQRELTGPEVEFPAWVTGPTGCAFRTFSTVFPRTDRLSATQHGAIRIERQFVNRPTVIVPRIGLPGFYTVWADEK